MKLKEILPTSKIVLGRSFETKCPACQGDMVRGQVSCPDNKPGCSMMHYGYICLDCAKQWGEVVK